MKTIILYLTVLAAVFFICSHAKALTPYQWHEYSAEYDSEFEKVVAAVTNYDKYTEILPYIDKMKILSRRGPESICYFERFVLNTTFWMQLRFKVATSTENMFILKTDYLKGNAHQFESVVMVQKISETKTLVTTRMIVRKPGPSFVPDTLINYYMDNFLKKSLTNLSKFLSKKHV